MPIPAGKTLVEECIVRVKQEAIRLLEGCAGSSRNGQSEASKVLILLDKKESDYTPEEINKIKSYLESELIARIKKHLSIGGAIVGYYISADTVKTANILPQVHHMLESLRKVRDKYDELQPSKQAAVDSKVLSLWQEMTDVKKCCRLYRSSMAHYRYSA